MRQGRIQCMALVALVTATVVAGFPGRDVAFAQSSLRAHQTGFQAKAADAQHSKRSANTLHQFSGTVSAIDKTSITVEKRGKKPETRVFTKHDEMRMTGEVEKDARVTVYYRDEGGKAIAHRVIVKSSKGSS